MPGNESNRPPRGGIGEGIRTGIGILAAIKEAVEDTFQEAVERGDLSPERAKRAVQNATDRLQGSVADIRERIEVVPRREHDELRAEVSALRERLDRLERVLQTGPETGEPGGPDLTTPG